MTEYTNCIAPIRTFEINLFSDPGKMKQAKNVENYK